MSNIQKAHQIAAINALDDLLSQGLDIDDLPPGPKKSFIVAFHPDSPDCVI